MDNVHFDNLYNNTMPNAGATAVPQFVKSDPSLFKDEVDIRFSRTLNNCKVPQFLDEPFTVDRPTLGRKPKATSPVD